MGNISKKIKAIVIASAVSTLIALSASSTALATPDDNRPDYLQQECDGTLCYDVATGEVTFTAKQETKSSYAEEKSSPQYNPCAGKGGYGSPSYDETVFLRITSSVFDEFVAYRTSTL